MARFSIKIFINKNGAEPFVDWLNNLDKSVQARINARVARFEDGLFGGFKCQQEVVTGMKKYQKI